MQFDTAEAVKPVTIIVERNRQQSGEIEPDILAGYECLPLVFRTLDGTEITRVLPNYPWDATRLQNAANGVANVFSDFLRQGANAYLGDQWVGSTEV